MERSKVYFTDFRTVLGVSLTDKLKKLIRMAGIGSIDMDGKFVAIKHTCARIMPKLSQMS